jgi:hypothetical protein
MADALVELLNSFGYQPVYLPRSGVVPPELYNYNHSQGRLTRRGPLRDYVPEVAQLAPTKGQLADITHKECSSKRMKGAVSFLDRALKCLGISSAPRLDLSFLRESDVVFSFGEVTFSSVDPSRLDQVLRSLALGAIPAAYADDDLHVAYEYAYARRVSMRRADARSFGAEVLGNLGAYLDLGSSGAVALESETTITFESRAGASAAFAYKAGRLEQVGGRWEFFPEEVTRSLDQPGRPFLVEAGTVLEAVE